MAESTLWIPKTEEEKEEVRRQMNRLLETAHFKNSRRYPVLFRFIVEETLEGRGEFLKERLLGIRVFNRAPNYDTSDDPIVRVTIAEIRKRIAQYYHEEAHETELRIELLPGRYEPEFHPSRNRFAVLAEGNGTGHSKVGLGEHEHESESKVAPTVAIPAVEASRPSGDWHKSGLSKLGVIGIGAAALAVAGIIAVVGWRWSHPSAIEEFWKPILSARRPIIFCLPTGAAGSNVAAAAGILSQSGPGPRPAVSTSAADVSSPTFLDHETEGENVVYSDALAMQRISNWLASHGSESSLRLNVYTTLDDLQQGPAILIGGLDNNWTLREIAHLRYRFSGTDQEEYWIVDNKNPGKRDWEVDLKTRYPAVQRDYALVARFHDDSTRQVEVVVAGIGMSGTAAAGKFLTDPAQINELRRRVGAGFRDHDFEAVLGMDVVNGMPGSPRILEVSVW
jgi:hypothetical protein